MNRRSLRNPLSQFHWNVRLELPSSCLASTWSSLILMDQMIWWWWIDHLLIWFWVHPPSLPLFRVGTDGYFNYSVRRNGVSVYAYKFKVSGSFEEDLFAAGCSVRDGPRVAIHGCRPPGRELSFLEEKTVHWAMDGRSESVEIWGSWGQSGSLMLSSVLGRCPLPSRLGTWSCNGGPGFAWWAVDWVTGASRPSRPLPSSLVNFDVRMLDRAWPGAKMRSWCMMYTPSSSSQCTCRALFFPVCPTEGGEARAPFVTGIKSRNQVQKLVLTPCKLASEWYISHISTSAMNRYMQRCMMMNRWP